MKILTNFVLALAVMTISAAHAFAAAESYSFDKAHTQILFFVDHLGFSKSQGEFHDYDGEILIDEKNPENSSVEIVIQTASIDMDDEKWDNHMKNEDFFNVDIYPTMTFKSDEVIVHEDGKSAIVKGDITILDVTKPLEINFTHNKSGKHPFSGKYVAGFSGETTIKRSDFGITYGLPMIGDDVRIMLEVEAERDDEVSEQPSEKQ